jgi:hypothetical protein
MTRPEQPTYTAAAVEAITQAHAAEHDLAGWLADVLARTAARVGGSKELLSGRSGSWEASHVRELLRGTLGPDDEMIMWYTPGQEGGRDG